MRLTFKPCSPQRKPQAKWALALGVFLLTSTPGASAKDDAASPVNANSETSEKPAERKNRGLWPQLSVLLRLPEDYQLRYPGVAEPPEEPAKYDRTFPLFAQQAIDRGFALPRPWGISLIGVGNEQGQDVSNVAVALGKGMAPPPDSDLVDLPFVGLNNVVSNTDTYQIKGDLWLLPNLNAFLALGKITGNVNLDVDIDLDA